MYGVNFGFCPNIAICYQEQPDRDLAFLLKKTVQIQCDIFRFYPRITVIVSQI